MSTDPIPVVAVIGAGAWGTALAQVLARAGRLVRLCARRAELAEAMARERENATYLPGVGLDPAIALGADARAALDGAGVALLAVPAQHLGAAAAAIAAHFAPGIPAVICAKGVERTTLRTMSEVAAASLPGHPIALLSGPTFAGEVARGLPTAVTLACADETVGARLVASIGTPSFRPYLTDDVAGAQIGGAVKNVIAIACGIVVGRRLGENARAALVARGLAEITRLGVALGGRRATLTGLSGLGDLALTCGSPQSRNLSLGIKLGEGSSLAAALEGRRSVAEGVASAASVTALAARRGVEMPICEAVDAVLHRGAPIDAAIAGLLARPFRQEE